MSEQKAIEGPEAFRRFADAMRAVVAVPAETVKAKVEAHRREAAANPNRRGPKPKRRG